MSERESDETRFYRKLRHTVKIWMGGERSKANRYANLIMAGPDLFMLMVRLARDERVGRAEKAKLVGAIAYFMNPLDFLPELILGPAGLVDDIALSAFVLHDVLEKADPAIVREHWEGEANLLDLIRQILASADAMVGGPTWRRVLAQAQRSAIGG